MSFIAGYFTRKDKYDSLVLEERVKSFPVITGEEPDSYESSVVETKFGHVIQKYKRNYPVQSKPCGDGEDNLLVTLGFLFSGGSLIDHKSILESCVRDSAEVLEEYEGEFVAIFSEGSSGKVHIINDRFASRPFYILQDYDHTYFSSNLAFLLYLSRGQHPIDILGWFQIFSFGHTCGTRTTIRDVRRIKPAAHLIISPEGLHERQYWHIEHKPEADLDPVAYSTEVFEAFQSGAALRAKLTRKGVIALSGGLDSRLVAAALPRDVDFSAFTFVDSAVASSTAQTQAAADVCDALGLPHRIQPISSHKFSEVARQVIELTGGLRPLHHMAVVMPYIHEIRDKGLNFLLGGGPGDVIAGSKIPSSNYLDTENVDKCIKNFCRGHVSGGDELALLFHKGIVKQYSRDLYNSLLESFENIPGPTAAHRVTNWAMTHRWPAFTFTSVVHNHPEVTEAFCHLDYKFCDLMLKLPAEWLYERSFYSFMIYQNLTQLRHIIYANTGKPVSGKLTDFKCKLALPRRAKSVAIRTCREIVDRSHLSRKFVRLIRSKMSQPELPSFNYSLFRNDSQLLSEISDCLHSYRSLEEVLDRKKCLLFLDNFKAGRFQAQSYNQQTELLGSLATMCLSFRHLSPSTL